MFFCRFSQVHSSMMASKWPTHMHPRKVIKLQRQRFPDLKWVHADLRRMPRFKDKSFDIVIEKALKLDLHPNLSFLVFFSPVIFRGLDGCVSQCLDHIVELTTCSIACFILFALVFCCRGLFCRCSVQKPASGLFVFGTYCHLLSNQLQEIQCVAVEQVYGIRFALHSIFLCTSHSRQFHSGWMEKVGCPFFRRSEVVSAIARIGRIH